MAGSQRITLVHLSGTQFGDAHPFGKQGLTDSDQRLDSLFNRLHQDLRKLKTDQGLQPDLLVVSGDLSARAVPSEFDRAAEFLDHLARELRLPRHRVVVVPGKHDVNQAACEGYFLQCEATETDPQPPYWPKWENFARMLAGFYGVDHVQLHITRQQPWILQEMPDLRLVVAAINSTIAESHKDHHGYIGENQLTWFAESLKPYERDGWLRIAVTHHNLIRDPQNDDENLKDVGDIERILAPHLNLILHGNTHTAKLQRLGNGLPVLSTGSAAVAQAARPADVPNHYHVVEIYPDQIKRWARRYESGEKRWTGDNRVSERGDSWMSVTPEPFASVHATFRQMEAVDTERPSGSAPQASIEQDIVYDDFLTRVAEICRLTKPGTTVQPFPPLTQVDPPLQWMLVTVQGDKFVHQYPVGAAEHGVSAAYLEAFIEYVHRRHEGWEASMLSYIVYGGHRPSRELEQLAESRGVRLKSFAEYQGILDLRRYVTTQREKLDTDPDYASNRYVRQPFALGREEQSVHHGDDLLEEVLRWLRVPTGRLILVQGEASSGKTFLLRQLVRRIPGEFPKLTPLLLDLQQVEKVGRLSQPKEGRLKMLLARHLATAGEGSINFSAFDYMLREGRIALLIDGFDVIDEWASEDLDTILGAIESSGKVILTFRSQSVKRVLEEQSLLPEYHEVTLWPAQEVGQKRP